MLSLFLVTEVHGYEQLAKSCYLIVNRQTRCWLCFVAVGLPDENGRAQILRIHMAYSLCTIRNDKKQAIEPI